MTGQGLVPGYDAGSLVSILDRIGDAAAATIRAIPTMDDEALAALHESAGTVEGQAWRVVVHVRAEMLWRARDTARQRGVLVGDVVGEVAERLHASSGDLYRDERIHELFLGPSAPEDILGVENLDKVFYQEASNALDPHAALRLMADQRDQRGQYNSRDAREDVRALREGATPAQLQAAADREPLQESASLVEDLGGATVRLTEEALRCAGLWDLEEIEVVSRPGSITLRRFRKGSRR